MLLMLFILFIGYGSIIFSLTLLNESVVTEGEQVHLCLHLFNVTLEENIFPLIGLAGSQNTSKWYYLSLTLLFDFSVRALNFTL